MSKSIEGYAVAIGDAINCDTVSSTRRAAIVNWLVVCCRITVYSSASDEDIEKAWNIHSPSRGAVCGKVTITLSDN